MRPSADELHAAYHTLELERFWSKVSLEGPLHPVLRTRCWVWLGAHQQGREYGVFRLRGRVMPAGKAALILSGVVVREELLICHRCDNPPCVRPDHLFQGTDKANAEDMVLKGRSSSGTKHYRALLTEDDVQTIVAAHLAGETGASLALRFGVSRSAVGAILQGTQWKCLTGGQVHSRGKVRGEEHHHAKLTEDQVVALRKSWRTGKLNISQTARDLGVTRNTLRFALQGKTWANIK